MKKIAVIGIGMMGLNHIKALRELGLGVFAVMDTDADRTEAFALANNVDHFTTDFNDLRAWNVEVLHICTPPESHYKLVKEALLANMHVICEKPFVFDEAQGRELINLAKSRKLVNAIDFNIRYHDACAKARDLNKDNEFGDVVLFNGSYMQEFHALPAFYSWRYEEKFLATTEIGSHWIDTLRYVTGKEISSVSAVYRNFFEDRVVRDGVQYPASESTGTPFNFKADNAVVVTFKMADNSIANCVLSEITPGRQNYLEFTLTGSKASFWWNTEDLNRYHIGRKGKPVEENVLAFGDGFNASIGKMLKDVYSDIESVSGEHSYSELTKPRYATFEDGLINTKICNAIYESANNNSKWVSVV